MKNKRLLWMLPLLVIAAGLALFGDKTPQGESASLSSGREEMAAGQTASAPLAELEVIDPASGLLRLGNRAALAQALEEPAGEDPFANGIKPPQDEAQQIDQNSQPPDFPYAFIGKMHDGERWKVFFDRDDKTFIVGKGAKLDGDFRVDAVRPPELQVKHLPSKHSITVQIDEAQ